MAMQHSAGFLAVVNDAKTRVRQIDMAAYREILGRGEEHLLVDVREDNEWQAGHAAGAKHIGKGIIERDIETQVPDKAARLVLYCGGGYRSALAADMLGKMGYMNVLSLDGGWRAWQEAGMPVEP
ncbi:MAG: rhodanese-like domain-containing protein [Bryobacteraceae bacterium]